MTTPYGLTKFSPRADERRLVAAFDGVCIGSLPRMVEDEDGALRPAWLRITPGSHGDDSTVKMETAGKKYAPSTRWNPETRTREMLPDAPRWSGRIVVYATARWQIGDVVRVEVWESVVHGETREFWRLVWTASPQMNGRTLTWFESEAAQDGREGLDSRPDRYLLQRSIEGGPDDARKRGTLVVIEEDDPVQRVFNPDEA